MWLVTEFDFLTLLVNNNSPTYWIKCFSGCIWVKPGLLDRTETLTIPPSSFGEFSVAHPATLFFCRVDSRQRITLWLSVAGSSCTIRTSIFLAVLYFYRENCFCKTWDCEPRMVCGWCIRQSAGSSCHRDCPTTAWETQTRVHTACGHRWFHYCCELRQGPSYW